MKRFKVIGLCLVAVFALSAVMASGAQAGQFGQCEKAAKEGKLYTGLYTEKLCSTRATLKEREEGKKNKYEWVPNAAVIKFTSEGGVSKLKGGPGEIECKHGTDSGEIINANENRDTFTFYECTLQPFGLKCKNAEVEITNEKTKLKEKVGVIVSTRLHTTLLDHGTKGGSGKEPKEGEVWDEVSQTALSPSPFGTEENPEGLGPWLAVFECEGIPFAVHGDVSSVIPAAFVEHALKKGKAGKKGKLGKATYEEDYTETGGEQDLHTILYNPEGSPPGVEEVSSIQLGTNLVIMETLPSKGFAINPINESCAKEAKPGKSPPWYATKEECEKDGPSGIKGTAGEWLYGA